MLDGRKWGMTANEYGLSFWDCKNDLKLCLNIKQWTVCVKWVNYIEYELCVKKVVIEKKDYVSLPGRRQTENISMTGDIAPWIFSRFCITLAFWKTITPASLAKEWLNSKQILEFKDGDLQEDLWTYHPEVTVCFPQQRSLFPDLGGGGAQVPAALWKVQESPFLLWHHPQCSAESIWSSLCHPVGIWGAGEWYELPCELRALPLRVLEILLMHVCTYVYIFMCAYICAFTYMCVYTCMCVHAYIRVSMQV